ncbi:hypothetical protein GCM10020366_16000 [Saccharopolyspora gregorii]|uniref:DUF5753 domain-containing protein n=2 Tax=Saccharopolyspora gregorii TaxID=33914 RepID=A0ABP6RKB0_9PSEU
MRSQAARLLEEAQRENVTLQVIPFGTGLHAGVVGAFTLLEYDGEPSLVGMEQLGASLLLDEDEHIRMYVDAWQSLQAVTLSPADSLELVRDLVVQLRTAS